MSEDRRQEDKRIDEIHTDVKEIRNILQSENGVCVRLSVNEKAVDSLQNELTDPNGVKWYETINTSGVASWSTSAP